MSLQVYATLTNCSQPPPSDRRFSLEKLKAKESPKERVSEEFEVDKDASGKNAKKLHPDDSLDDLVRLIARKSLFCSFNVYIDVRRPSQRRDVQRGNAGLHDE